MSDATPAGIQTFVQGFLMEKLRNQGMDLPDYFSDQCDLLLSGIIDSMGLLELITAIQVHCEKEIDFDALDPELMTVVGQFCQFVSEQVIKQ
jgi:acyl carrier protein